MKLNSPFGFLTFISHFWDYDTGLSRTRVGHNQQSWGTAVLWQDAFLVQPSPQADGKASSHWPRLHSGAASSVQLHRVEYHKGPEQKKGLKNQLHKSEHRLRIFSPNTIHFCFFPPLPFLGEDIWVFAAVRSVKHCCFRALQGSGRWESSVDTGWTDFRLGCGPWPFEDWWWVGVAR